MARITTVQRPVTTKVSRVLTALLVGAGFVMTLPLAYGQVVDGDGYVIRVDSIPGPGGVQNSTSDDLGVPGSLTAGTVSATLVSAVSATTLSLSAASITTVDISASNGTIDNLSTTSGSISALQATNASVVSLTSGLVSTRRGFKPERIKGPTQAAPSRPTPMNTSLPAACADVPAGDAV